MSSCSLLQGQAAPVAAWPVRHRSILGSALGANLLGSGIDCLPGTGIVCLLNLCGSLLYSSKCAHPDLIACICHTEDCPKFFRTRHPSFRCCLASNPRSLTFFDRQARCKTSDLKWQKHILTKLQQRRDKLASG